MAGGSKSQDTTSTTANYDQRQVNTWDTSSYDLSDRSTTNTTTNADFSNRSTTTTNADFSNRSTTTTNADLSNRSVNNTTVNNTTTDFGAVKGALSVASDAVAGAGQQLASALGFATRVTDGQNATLAHSYDFADNVFHGALDAVQSTDTRALDAYSRAATIENDALSMSKDSFSNAMGMVQNAYADAKGTTQAQQKIMIGVLLVAAVAVVAPRLGK